MSSSCTGDENFFMSIERFLSSMESTMSKLSKLIYIALHYKRVLQKENNGSHNMPSKSTVSQISKLEMKEKKRTEQKRKHTTTTNDKRQTTNEQPQPDRNKYKWRQHPMATHRGHGTPASPRCWGRAPWW